MERRVRRAENLVHVGELSSARKALEGAALAPGTRATLDKLQDARRRPPQPREPLPPEIMGFQPATLFDLDEKMFCRNLHSARQGVVGGPSGMTCEHLRPLLDEVRAMQQLFKLGENLARAQVPPVVVNMVRCGRMTVLAKPDGGVRGVVSGDVLRRLVARTMAQQLGPAVKAATSPQGRGVSASHTLQGLCELNPRTTITSIDGVGACDLISPKPCNSSLPFVRMFQYLWEDDFGETHSIPQGEGGEQGDAMMPLLHSVGQHEAFQAAHRGMWDGEHLMAFLDDVHMASDPDRVGPVYATVQDALWEEAGIRIHVGKTKVWNAAGIGPAICDVLERVAQEQNPAAQVRRGRGIPVEQGSKSWEPHLATQHTSRGS